MKTIKVQFYPDLEVNTVIISSIKYITDLEMDDGIHANLVFMNDSRQLLRLTREQVTELINRR